MRLATVQLTADHMENALVSSSPITVPAPGMIVFTDGNHRIVLSTPPFFNLAGTVTDVRGGRVELRLAAPRRVARARRRFRATHVTLDLPGVELAEGDVVAIRKYGSTSPKITKL